MSGHGLEKALERNACAEFSSQENFADHTWITGAAGQPTRMIAIANGDESGSLG